MVGWQLEQLEQELVFELELEQLWQQQLGWQLLVEPGIVRF